jgi:hypothetical protein
VSFVSIPPSVALAVFRPFRLFPVTQHIQLLPGFKARSVRRMEILFFTLN